MSFPASPFQSKRPFQSRPGYFNQKGSLYRKNDRIRALDVRVIAPDGKQIGVLPTREAIKLAKDLGLDLVEISPNAKPPVCKITDFGKLMYEESKKSKATKTVTADVKEFKFRLNIQDNDYETKLRQAEKLLYKGAKIKITLNFKGRELSNTKMGFDIIKRVIVDLEGIAHPDAEPKLAGRNIILMLSPLPANKRKLKFNQDSED